MLLYLNLLLAAANAHFVHQASQLLEVQMTHQNQGNSGGHPHRPAQKPRPAQSPDRQRFEELRGKFVAALKEFADDDAGLTKVVAAQFGCYDDKDHFQRGALDGEDLRAFVYGSPYKLSAILAEASCLFGMEDTVDRLGASHLIRVAALSVLHLIKADWERINQPAAPTATAPEPDGRPVLRVVGNN